MRRIPAKWTLCGFLFLATTLNYLDRQTISILAPSIQKEMGLDNVALGWLFSAFYYSYTFAQFGIGAVLDRKNLRWMYGSAVLAWSAVAALTSLSSGFAMLLGFRVLLGVTEAANWPGAIRIVSRALPPAERAMGNGIFTSGTSIGALIAPGLILGISAIWGWRWSFVAVGSLGAVWFAGWLWITRAEELRTVWKTEPGATPSTSARNAYAEILKSGQFWPVFCVTILVNPCLYFNLNWLPTYFAQERGLTAGKDLGWYLTAIYLGLDLGYLACGAFVLWLTRAGILLPRARRTVFIGATVLLGASSLVPLFPTPQGALAALVVVNFAMGIWISMYLTMAQEVSSVHVSTAAGILGGSGSLAGAFAMWGVGKVTQQAGFTIPFISVSVIAVAAAVAGWMATRAHVKEEVATAI